MDSANSSTDERDHEKRTVKEHVDSNDKYVEVIKCSDETASVSKDHDDKEEGDGQCCHESGEDRGRKSLFSRVINFYFANEFIFLILLAIALAKAYPPLGADYLQPNITATWLGVIVIFGASRMDRYGQQIHFASLNLTNLACLQSQHCLGWD